MRNETDVRCWVRNLGLNVVWVEAGRGGTGGAADCFVSFAPGLIVPVELKFWDVTSDGKFFCAKMRREQVRFHAVMAKRGERTLLLWGRPGSKWLFAVGGQNAPKQVSCKFPCYIARGYTNTEGKDFCRDVVSGYFWNKNEEMARGMGVIRFG